jgi:hypothetical protein
VLRVVIIKLLVPPPSLPLRLVELDLTLGVAGVTVFTPDRFEVGAHAGEVTAVATAGKTGGGRGGLGVRVAFLLETHLARRVLLEVRVEGLAGGGGSGGASSYG